MLKYLRNLSLNKALFVLYALLALGISHFLAVQFEHQLVYWIKDAKVALGDWGKLTWLVYPLMIGALFFVADKAHTHGSNLQGVRTLSVVHRRPARVMVFTVSSVFDPKALQELVETGRCHVRPGQPDGGELLRTTDLPHDLAMAQPSQGRRLSTFQILRGMVHTLATLQRVHFITTKESADIAPLVRQWVLGYKPGLEVQIHGPIDPDDVDGIHATFEKIIHAEVHAGVSVEDIVIDVTGGTKPISIAGAMATVNSRVCTQYVPNGWNKEPLIVDLINESARHGLH